MHIRWVDILRLFSYAFRALFVCIKFSHHSQWSTFQVRRSQRTRAPAWIVSVHRNDTCSGRLVVRSLTRIAFRHASFERRIRWPLKNQTRCEAMSGETEVFRAGKPGSRVSDVPSAISTSRRKTSFSVTRSCPSHSPPHTAVRRLPGEFHRRVTETAVAGDTCRCYGTRRPVLALLRFAPSPPRIAHDHPAGVLRAVGARKTPCCYFQFTRVPCRERVPSCERF